MDSIRKALDCPCWLRSVLSSPSNIFNLFSNSHKTKTTKRPCIDPRFITGLKLLKFEKVFSSLGLAVQWQGLGVSGTKRRCTDKGDKDFTIVQLTRTTRDFFFFKSLKQERRPEQRHGWCCNAHGSSIVNQKGSSLMCCLPNRTCKLPNLSHVSTTVSSTSQ